MAQRKMNTGKDRIYNEIKDLTIQQIKDRITRSSIEELNSLLVAVKSDSRKGVAELEGRIKNLLNKKYKKEQKKATLLKQERILWNMGYEMIGGIDEAGRGPLAGPVIAACVIFPPEIYIEGIDDSKRLTSARREKLYDEIMDKAVSVGIGRIGPDIIDKINILNATREAMKKAVLDCIQKPDFLLIDALKIDIDIPYISMIKGDQRSHSIAAASIIAKVTRDREMLKWHDKYPVYGFNKHKGYGTTAHIDALHKWGACLIHRQSFIKKFITGREET